MPPQHSRRAFIQAIGGVSFTGLAGSATAASGTTDESTIPSAADLVIPETAVPNGFERYSPEDANRGAAPFIEKLQQLDPRFRSVATAGNAFWKGEGESDPQWVLSSIALVGADSLPRLHLEKAADVFYDEYIDGHFSALDCPHCGSELIKRPEDQDQNGYSLLDCSECDNQYAGLREDNVLSVHHKLADSEVAQ